MARRRAKAAGTAKAPEPPQYHAHIGRDAKGNLYFLGYQAGGGVQAGSGLTPVAVVDIGRPFEHRIPSVRGQGRAGLVIEGMTGVNAEPWSASTVLSAARQAWFGFRLIEPEKAAEMRERR